jgi:ATP-dependent Clp protease, protease subunit
MKRTSGLPYVIEKGTDGERSYDIYSRLLEDRIIFLGTEINDTVANAIIAQLLLLDQKDSSRDISLYINSPGGSVTAGLAILDTINYLNSNVRTVCVGMAASMAAILLSAGAKGKRIALPNSHIMIHQPNQTMGGQTMTVTEQEIDLKLIKTMKKQLIDILAKNCGQPVKKVYKDCEFDKWFSAKAAKEYGLIDDIILKKKPE